MSGLVRRFRGLPLRSRLALLVATAVAVAVAMAAAVCWFVVRDALVDSLDDSLNENRLRDSWVRDMIDGDGRCRQTIVEQNNASPNLLEQIAQVVDQTGGSCVVLGKQSLGLKQADTEVARREAPSAFHDATASDGTEYRVLTYPLDGTPYAVSLARPLSEVHDTLDNLTLLLSVVGGVGILGAGAAGLWVARTGLRPVDRLTEAVEHVARTEDLDLRIPVEGDDEIARLSESFNSMTASLASSRDLQQQLIADAGHELRTPLTSLRTNIELLVRSEDTGRAIPPDDRRALLASVKAQMTELAALIGDLQELSRPDAGHGGAKVQVIALHDIVEAALDRARLRGPELTFTADLSPWYVRAEPAALERAVVNLLDNAVKFGPPGSAVEVALRAGELTVRDHGPGIPAEELPHVFDRFWRSPSARSLPGSGLGLSIVARTVRQSGGEVTLRAADGGGTVASVRLPGAATPPPSQLP
ncbi:MULTISPECIES: HAMP domain-containing sensor histidine kinase [Streptomyces]|uniref:HAMP domain-containing sensor histidine kinase n=1 Tax=Streptomyces TaxID=1883 RepID=UPI001E29130F|nr:MULTISPECIES: HAMP domain-containing sensor histidine kinase [Streptomyces]UFQ16602.1 HAMP domain-containing histidine kinase [Streptomyces huasconensis]WCL86203.1 HAMP domain-containing sensor histidine kinase [Streptomyces sp. JCM 35825]